jgi:hypothetical protein
VRAKAATLVGPDALRWQRRLVAQKYDGSSLRSHAGRRTQDIVELVLWPRDHPRGLTRVCRDTW